MIIDYVHNHSKALLVECLDGSFKLSDAHLAVAWISRVRALRHIVVNRVVAPIKLATAPFVDRAEVIDGHELQVSDADMLEISQSCLGLTVAI